MSSGDIPHPAASAQSTPPLGIESDSAAARAALPQPSALAEHEAVGGASQTDAVLTFTPARSVRPGGMDRIFTGTSDVPSGAKRKRGGGGGSTIWGAALISNEGSV
eukprot:TRINITY_DN67634_c0_g1_i1.p2 TRINITY_DN67634_c0_g1~~TRINITY_DN67634_c0_g1_i1.p2  ORF type:complete len:106 (-),score=6.28 TRINITY_DN67634_c0_g1_i1:212-529(-)